MICKKFFHKVFNTTSYLNLLNNWLCEGTVLDVGCGGGGPMINLKVKELKVGVDAFEQYIKQAREKNAHDEYIIADVRYLPIKSKSFDIVLGLDLMEHLEKNEGYRLLKTLENIAKKRVIVFTPNGFLAQEEYDSNPLQIHRSGWTVDEFRKLGYRCVGVNGLKLLRTYKAKLLYEKGFLKYLNFILSEISEKIVLYAPKFAFQLLCLKEV